MPRDGYATHLMLNSLICSLDVTFQRVAYVLDVESEAFSLVLLRANGGWLSLPRSKLCPIWETPPLVVGNGRKTGFQTNCGHHIERLISSSV